MTPALQVQKKSVDIKTTTAVAPVSLMTQSSVSFSNNVCSEHSSSDTAAVSAVVTASRSTCAVNPAVIVRRPVFARPSLPHTITIRPE